MKVLLITDQHFGVRNDNQNFIDHYRKFYSEVVIPFVDANKIDTIIDNTEENFSSKMKKFNLIGVPYQILLGKKTDDDMLEFKKVGEESVKLKIDEIIKIINSKKN